MARHRKRVFDTVGLAGARRQRGRERRVVVVLVLLSAAVGALALVLMRKATQAQQRRPGFSLALLWSLIRHRPVWAAGVVAMVVEFVLQSLALAGGPVSVVQVLVVTELPFCLILSRLVLGGRLGAREWSAVAAMTIGIIVLLLALAPHGGTPDSLGLRTWLRGLAVTIAVIVGLLVAGRWTGAAARTALAGVAAGMTAGLVAVLVKPVTSTVGRGLGAVLATWQSWAVLVVSAAAFLLLQNAMQAGRLVAAQPGITLANPLVAAAWGVLVFHEQVRTGWWLLGAGLGAASLVGGAVLLSGSPLLAGYREAPLYAPVAASIGGVAGWPVTEPSSARTSRSSAYRGATGRSPRRTRTPTW